MAGRGRARRACCCFCVMGQLLTLDMSLTLYMTVCARGLSAGAGAARAAAGRSSARLDARSRGLAAAPRRAHQGPGGGRHPRRPSWSSTASMRAISAPWRRLHVASGLPLFLAITVPWHWLAARRLPDFLQFFFVHEHLARYLTPSADREEAWWFFGAVFLLGSAPWTLPRLRVLCLGWRRRAARGGIQSRAVPLDLGAVRVRVLFALRLQTHSLHLAGDAGARAADRRLADEALQRDVLRTALLTVALALVLALLCMFAPSSSPRPSAASISCRSPSR